MSQNKQLVVYNPKGGQMTASRPAKNRGKIAVASAAAMALAPLVARMLQTRAAGQAQRPKKQGGRSGMGPLPAERPTSQPVALSFRQVGSRLRFGATGDTMSIAHREFIGPMNGTTVSYPTSSAYGTSYIVPIDVSNPVLFPWVAQIAPLFSQWRLKRLRLRYIPTTYTNNTGLFMAAHQPDAGDSVPTTEQEIMQFARHVEGSVWAPQTLDVDVNANGNAAAWRFTDLTGSQPQTVGGSPASQAVARQVAYGNLLAFVFGQNASAARVGGLEVDYEIEFKSPVYSINTLTGAVSSLISLNGVTGQTPAVPFGTVSSGSTGAAAFSTTSTGALQFSRPGQYEVTSYVTGTGLTSGTTSSSCSGSGQSSCKPMFTGITDVVANSAGTNALWVEKVNIAAPGDTWSGILTGLATTVTAIATYVVPLLYSL